MHLTVPPAFHPPSSLLGRLVRRWSADERQAASRYIVAAALVFVAVTLAGQWGWVLWSTGADGDPALGYFLAQGVAGLVMSGVCLLGWRQPIHVRADANGLAVRRGAETLVLAYGEVQSAKRITADAYHRHWQRYAATRAFVNRLPADLLLLHTARGPVVLGLTAADLGRLDAHLAGQLEPDRTRRFVHAA